MKTSSVLKEKQRSTILFLWLFYIVFFAFDIIYPELFILPMKI